MELFQGFLAGICFALCPWNRPLIEGHMKQLTFLARGQRKLIALCEALDMHTERNRFLEIFDVFSETWGSQSGQAPSFDSDITDDHSPFEFSLALEGGHPELRMLVEAQGQPATTISNWEASWRLNERLKHSFGASLERARQIEDLFRPEGDTDQFALWHAVCLKRGAPPDFKIYLNPQAKGEGQADKIVREALVRLGFSHAWDWIAAHALRRGSDDRVIYFSLDLSQGPRARVKIYVAHYAATANELESVMAGAPEYEEGDALRFCTAMTGRSGPYRARPIITCMAFVAADDTRPFSVTFHLPIRCYAESDRSALERICTFLSPADAVLYERAITAMAERRLEDGVGLQTYASFRRQGNRKRLTVYLSPELYKVTAPRKANSNHV
jgi:DMATS type aromatic prenyltransferase